MSTRKGRIRASTENVGSGQVPERWDPGKYWRMVRENTGKVDPGEYRKGGIRTSTRKVGSERVPGRWDPGEYREGRNPGEYQKW